MEAKFLLSTSKVLKKFDEVKNMSDIVSYSSKTNPRVTQILENNTDCWFSIHLLNELKNITDLSRVLFLAQAWNYNLIDSLINKGVDKFVLDNISDLNILLSYLSKNDVKIDLMLRIKLKENTIRTEKYYVFGISSKEVNYLIKDLKNNEKIRSLGIHFHRKTQNMSEWNLESEFCEIIDDEVIKIVDYVNIGGGLPSVYANTNIKVFDSIKKKILEFKEFLNERDVKMIIEPGRFIAAPSIELITEVIGVNENTIIVNASVYNSDLDALIVPVKLRVKGELKKGEGTPYIIKGLTPCSLDLFRYRVYIKDIKVGDKLIFENAGAYNFRSDFCDLEKIETEIVK